METTLRVGGWVPFTTLDFPGKLSAVVFCQGCPWRCYYCHNPHLLPFENEDPIPWEVVRDFLVKRAGLLDAVVFSGGEPTAQASLADCLREVRKMGYALGLHTSGAYPDRLAEILPLVDWVGLDIKAHFADYAAVTQATTSGQKTRQSLSLILQSGIAFECRTTHDPAALSFEDLANLAQYLSQIGVKKYAVQVFRPVSDPSYSNLLTMPPHPTSPSFPGPPSEGWMHFMNRLFEQFTYRAYDNGILTS